MRDHQDGLVPRERFHGLLQLVLVFGIDVGGGLVEDDDGRVLEHGAGNGNALLLAARERGPALANDGVIAVRQGHDEIVATGFLCRGDHFFMRGLRAAEADVVLYGVREEVHALKDHAHLFHQRFQRVVAHVRAADADRAAVHIPESGDEVAKRRLAAAAGPMMAVVVLSGMVRETSRRMGLRS